MKARPMLARGSVVRAMLADLQTQDRRPAKPQPKGYREEDGIMSFGKYMPCSSGGGSVGFHISNAHFYAPYNPGDIIWVRETWMSCFGLDGNGYAIPDTTLTLYRATDVAPDGPDGSTQLPWKPSIHMPKKYCRLFLKVNAARIERIQDISEADAIAEGVEHDCGWEEQCGEGYTGGHGFLDYGTNEFACSTAKESFRTLWESLYPGSWERNEWVWVNGFERTDKPADWPQN